ncbi:MAG: hypothetical protein ACK5MK_15875 [Dysgonomonas sp.]
MTNGKSKNPLYDWNTLHSSILTRYLYNLDRENIRYFILRNYEELPEKNDSKDVDIIIAPGFYDAASKLLLSAFKEFGISNYYVVRYERVRCWIGIDVEKNFSIHIDIMEGYLNKGFEIFDFETLYANTIPYKEFRVLNVEYDIALLILYKIISSKELKNKYREKIEAGYKEYSEKIDSILKCVLGAEGKEISEMLQRHDYEGIINQSARISFISKKIAFYKKPVRTIINVSRFWIEKLYRIGWCPNKYRKFLAVEAPDGTGKTTFIEGVCDRLAYFFVCDIDKMNVYHFRPTILPNLGAVGEKAGMMEQDKDFTNPHRSPSANVVSSFIRMVYYWLDYLVGVPLKLRKDVQFDKFTIYDRYIYDFLIDPKRSRIKLPFWMRKLFSKMVLQPSLVFVLETEAEIIFKRKQELSINEINRQLGEFQKLSATNERFVTIDATKSPQLMVGDATAIIIDKFTRKTTDK